MGVATRKGHLSGDVSYSDHPETLIFVHIGKCGGASLWDAIKRSGPVNDKFTDIFKIHIMRPPVLTKARYLFVVRNPIARATSAFNWRKKLVATIPAQAARFKGEKAALARYATFNTLAEALYAGPVLNTQAADDFRKIHHLKEDMRFYLDDLMGVIRPDQIMAVLTTENLDADIDRHLAVAAVPRLHENPQHSPLSPRATRNLHRFLRGEYAVLTALLEVCPHDIAARTDLLA